MAGLAAVETALYYLLAYNCLTVLTVMAAQLGGWGGHAWNSAYDRQAGRWIHLDAAYPGVPRSCYIRTGSSSNQEAGGTNAMKIITINDDVWRHVEPLLESKH